MLQEGPLRLSAERLALKLAIAIAIAIAIALAIVLATSSGLMGSEGALVLL